MLSSRKLYLRVALLYPAAATLPIFLKVCPSSERSISNALVFCSDEVVHESRMPLFTTVPPKSTSVTGNGEPAGTVVEKSPLPCVAASNKRSDARYCNMSTRVFAKLVFVGCQSVAAPFKLSVDQIP